MERKFIFSQGEFYHIYNRGNNKSPIFLDNKDRSRFTKLLYICNSTKPVVFKTIQGLPLDKIERGSNLVNIGAYCLMPNHFHLLIHEKNEKGISDFMGKISTAYSMYFNKKYERTGSLFEGTFKATHVDNDEYLKYLFSYIHLNPVKLIDSDWKSNGISDRDFAQKYLLENSHSSYLDYMGVDRECKIILNKEEFPEYFSKPKDFDDFINDWLLYNDYDIPRFTLG